MHVYHMYDQEFDSRPLRGTLRGVRHQVPRTLIPDPNTAGAKDERMQRHLRLSHVRRAQKDLDRWREL